MGALVTDLRLTLVCRACGIVDIPTVIGRQPVVVHYDPTTGKICENRQGSLMLLRHPIEAEG